ncbi:hypothetical protein MIND_00079800 [Mycena indigotica]|uniref:Uncharacterized protein n=1 Tax=Mycena indigotica TaxID=2126181 RepID=A0A8H6TBT5_9AGAR|nr:uncharacterized protein MIND_00079800 [Mycena indigotica]KAF7315643.1 hypothetical protein MIND_00079800 [Mycena indigotica]
MGSVTTYQQSAAGVCSGGTYNSMHTDCQQHCCVLTEAWFQGSSGQRSQCWNAFNNIIAQCVQGNGRNGGQWIWSYQGVTQNYYLQANWVCTSAAGIQSPNNSTEEPPLTTTD